MGTQKRGGTEPTRAEQVSAVGVGDVAKGRGSEKQTTPIEPDEIRISRTILTKVIHHAAIPGTTQGVVWVIGINGRLSFFEESKGGLEPPVVDVRVRLLRVG